MQIRKIRFKVVFSVYVNSNVNTEKKMGNFFKQFEQQNQQAREQGWDYPYLMILLKPMVAK